MEYGITFPRTGVADEPSPMKYLTHFAREAVQLGYAYAVVGDRLEGGIDPLSILTAIVEASGHMRLTTSVLVLPPRGILVAAKEYASLDVLSGGRVIAGVGTGSLFRDYEVVGMDHHDMWPRFEEGVQAMRAYLTPEAQPFKGRFYNTEGVNLEPTPVQRPSLPIWIGSWGSTAGLRRVARLADGWLSSAGPGHQPPEQFADDVKRLNAFLVQAGKNPTTFPSVVSTMALFISEDREELARIGGPGYVPRPPGVIPWEFSPRGQKTRLSIERRGRRLQWLYGLRKPRYLTRRIHESRIYWPGDHGIQHGTQCAQGGASACRA